MKSRVMWIGIVVGLLAFSVGTQAVLIVLSAMDPSFAIEQDDDWETRRAEEARNRELDWTLDLSTQITPDGAQVEVAVEAYDRWGKPIKDATISLEAFHNARASQVKTAALEHQADGRYTARMPIRRSGLWEFRLRATRGEAVFTQTTRAQVLGAVRGARR